MEELEDFGLQPSARLLLSPSDAVLPQQATERLRDPRGSGTTRTWRNIIIFLTFGTNVLHTNHQQSHYQDLYLGEKKDFEQYVCVTMSEI